MPYAPCPNIPPFLWDAGLRYAQLTIPATLHVAALVWFAETGSISILDLLGVNVRRNAFPTDPTTEIF